MLFGERGVRHAERAALVVDATAVVDGAVVGEDRVADVECALVQDARRRSARRHLSSVSPVRVTVTPGGTENKPNAAVAADRQQRGAGPTRSHRNVRVGKRQRAERVREVDRLRRAEDRRIEENRVDAGRRSTTGCCQPRRRPTGASRPRASRPCW